MKSINMHEAKTNLSRVVEDILATGSTYLICRNGTPVVEVRPYRPVTDPLVVDDELQVAFHADPSDPVDPEDWPEAMI